MDVLMEALKENWTYVLLEAFGYLGTALVFLSMMMTSVNKLRIVNMAGSVVSMTYAAICNTWPVVFLNFGLLIINSIQLIRAYRIKRTLKAVRAETHDASAVHILNHYLGDDALDLGGKEGFIIYDGARAIGVIMGELRGDELLITSERILPEYLDRSVAPLLLDSLRGFGIKSICTERSDSKKRNKQLRYMGFKEQSEKMIRIL